MRVMEEARMVAEKVVDRYPVAVGEAGDITLDRVVERNTARFHLHQDRGVGE